MRVGSLVLLSLLGMGGSSAAVVWSTPGTSGETEVVAAAERSELAVGFPAEAEADTVAESLPPTLSIDGTLRLEGRLGHAVLPGGEAQETFLMVEVAAPPEAAVSARAPVNVSIVIDRSGSMKGRRLSNAVAAARGMLSRLRPADTVSLVAYDDRAQLLLPPTTVERLDRFAFERTLADLRGRGHTCISCGVDMALTQLRAQPEAVHRILLLSDGVANRGFTRADDFRNLGDLARRERVTVASVGVDVDYDERPLFALSQASNGNHYFVEDPAGLPAVFDQEARSLVGTLADRVDVEVALAPGVEVLEVIARGHQRQDDGVTLSFGSLEAGQERSAVLRVRVQPGQGDRPIADLRLAYRDLASDRSRRVEGGLGLTLDPDVARKARLDARVEERLGRKDTLDALLTANESFARGEVVQARQQLALARDRIRRRKRRAGAAKDTKLDRDFERQLQALGSAQAGFDDAIRSAPKRKKKKAFKTRKAKKAMRKNAMTANPFG